MAIVGIAMSNLFHSFPPPSAPLPFAINDLEIVRWLFTYISLFCTHFHNGRKKKPI